MSVVVNSILMNADYFVLLTLRVSGLIFASPIFGRKNIPNMAKIAFTVSITFLLFTVFPPSEPVEYSSLFSFFLLCAGELLLGVALAFITNLFFSLTYIAGQIIDMQIGFGIVNVYDPQNNTQIPMLGNMLNIILIIVFFWSNGHHRLIEIIYLTINRIPVGALTFSPGIALVALEVFALTFTLGLMVAMPVIASGLVLEFVFGFLIRTVPQLNMFVVGVPVKLVAGMLMLMLIIPVFVNFSERIFSEMFAGIERMFGAFLGTT